MAASMENVAASWVKVKGQIPDQLMGELRRDFTPEEVERIYVRIRKTGAPQQEQPVALWIFGPSAVGKSRLTRDAGVELFGDVRNAVEVDGTNFRDEHAGWQEVTQHGHRHGLLHEDAWQIFKKIGVSTNLKKRVIKEAIAMRQHMIIPDVMNAPDKVESLMTQLTDAGYALFALCLWAPLEATRQRGEGRMYIEGKIWSGKEYGISTAGTFLMAQRFAQRMTSEPQVYKGVTMVCSALLRSWPTASPPTAASACTACSRRGHRRPRWHMASTPLFSSPTHAAPKRRPF